MNYEEQDLNSSDTLSTVEENIEEAVETNKNKLSYPLIIVSALLLAESLFVIVLTLWVSSIFSNVKHLEVNKAQEVSNELADVVVTLEEIDKYFSDSYVNDINKEDLELKMANALITSYGDKYGVYLDPTLTAKQNAELNNELQGIGVLVRAEVAESEEDFDRLYVIESYNGSDALDKGITKGCLITAVNNNKINFNELTYNDVIDQIRGEAGTTVSITYLDNKGKEVTCDIERREVDTTTVNYKVINNNVGYINIRDFTYNTDEELETVIKYMEHRNIDKFIFDLRDNTGGLLDTVVNMLDTLLREQDLIYIENKDKEIIETYSSDAKGYDFKAVCIINENTASASELFVKSLQEKGHSVIGTTSYGKGTVCSVIPLNNGGSLQLSTFKYLTSSKECIEGVGVVPDVEIELPEGKKKILYKLDIADDDIVVEAVKMLTAE